MGFGDGVGEGFVEALGDGEGDAPGVADDGETETVTGGWYTCSVAVGASGAWTLMDARGRPPTMAQCRTAASA